VVQTELREAFENDKAVLMDRIAVLETERDNSQGAFDKYRERARDSLMKSARELQAVEEKNKELREHIKVTPSTLLSLVIVVN